MVLAAGRGQQLDSPGAVPVLSDTLDIPFARLSSMITIRMKTPAGDEIFVPCTEGEKFVCPVCGLVAEDEEELAWMPDIGVANALSLNNAEAVTGGPSYDICPVCETQFGLWDTVPGTMAIWAKSRDEWREANRNKPEAIARSARVEEILNQAMEKYGADRSGSG
jgi:hypothetical protein